MKLSKNQKIILGVTAAAGIGVIAYKKLGGSEIPNSPLLQDPETLANYKFLKEAYKNQSPVKFITGSGADIVTPNFKEWLDTWMQSADAARQTTPPITDVDSAIINRAHWQGGSRIDRLVTVSGLGNISNQLAY